MITVKLWDIFQSTKILGELINNKMTARTGWNLNTIIEKCLAEMPKIEKVYFELIEKYKEGSITEGDNIQLTNENAILFNNEWIPFVQTDVELLCNKLTIDEIENCIITPLNLKQISAFIE
jgi:hypothetical protein